MKTHEASGSTHARKRKSGPKLRAEGDMLFREKAEVAFRDFQIDGSRRPMSELGYCFVDTALGTLQVDVGWLLILIGGILQATEKSRNESITIQLNDDVLEASIEVLRALPRYIEQDLLGLFFEADFLVRVKSRAERLPFTPPITVRKTFATILGREEGQGTFNRVFLGGLLARWPSALLLPEIATSFMRAASEKGAVDSKAWKAFLEKQFAEKKKRGRRREQLYDSLFKRKLENPALSYGRLALEIAKVRDIDVNTAREQLKAAISYRRRKATAKV